MGPCQANKNTKKHTNDSVNNNSILNSRSNTNQDLNKVDASNVKRAESNDNVQLPKKKPTQIQKELQNLRRATPFLPHIYNPLSPDDIKFYNNVISAKKENSSLPKHFSNINELKNHLKNVNIINEEPEYKNMIIAWKLFKWISENITFEGLKYDSNDKAYRIEDILTKRQASSYTISKFYQEVLTGLEIECEIIPGFIRGSKFNKPEYLFQWNAVKLFGKFRLVDCSSACKNSPFEENENVSHPQFYFCSIPHHLIYTHYPDNIKDAHLNNGSQLLDKTKYEELTILKKNFFIYGFQLMNFKSTEIECDVEFTNSINQDESLNELKINFCLLDDVLPELKLKFENYRYEDTERLFHLKRRKFDPVKDKKDINMIDYCFFYEDILDGTSELSSLTKLYENLKVYELSLRLPKKGEYEFEVYGKKHKFGNGDEIDTMSGNHCFSYKIHAEIDKMKQFNFEELEFPIIHDKFLECNATLVTPTIYHLGPLLKKKKNIDFMIKIPNATDVAIFYDGESEFVLMENQQEFTWHYINDCEKIFKNINIAASFGSNSEFKVVASYTL